MGYWGWRPLISAVFISVWVVGCTISATEIAPTVFPTETPPITLTVRTRQPRPPTEVALASTLTPTVAESTPQAALIYTVRPGDTLLGIALDFGVEVTQLQTVNPGVDPLQLQLGQQIIIPHVDLVSTLSSSPIPPVALSLPPPMCHDLPTDHVYCLGQVINHQTFPVERVRVRLQISHAGIVSERTVTVERPLIWPGQSAPYSALFSSAWADDSTAAAFLQTARVSDGGDYVRLVVENEQVTRQASRYRVHFALYNPSLTPTRSASATLLLLDSAANVVGYRVLEVGDSLNPGERQTLHVEAIAQKPNAVLTHVLYVDAH